MSSAAPRKLTERQRAVIERIDRRVPIKVIAQEMGVSETRINQHIRALKDIYAAASLNELVEEYRATKPPSADGDEGQWSEYNQETEENTENSKGFSEALYSKNQVFSRAATVETGQRVDRGQLVMGDVLPLIEQAPWLRPGEPGEPKVVPGVLDGEHAVLLRLAAIVGIGFGFLGALVLTLTAAVTISEALDGRATVPVDQTGPS
jgi:DNA-binding CsgD family transcriptional regulator